MLYSLVLLDGQEIHNLSLDEVKDMFFKRQINADSLVWCVEDPRWQMMKRAFNLSEWLAESGSAPAPPAPTASPFASPPPEGAAGSPFAPAFDAAAPAAPSGPPPVTFNQFPQVGLVASAPPSAAFPPQGYTQHNQSETYYQAESGHAGYNLGKAAGDFAPSRYNAPGNYAQPVFAGAPHGYSAAPPQAAIYDPDNRYGAKHAAVFIVLNTILFMIFGALARMAAGADPAAAKGSFGVGRSIIPIIIDVILAFQLFSGKDVEKARKWVLWRSYLGFFIFGIGVAAMEAKTAGPIFGLIDFVLAALYLVSIGLVLHGEREPTKSRVMIGMGTFAVYALMMFGAIGLMSLAQIVPPDAFADIDGAEFDRYRTQGADFRDDGTGATVKLPGNWTFIKLDNPLFNVPDAKMIAVDRSGRRMTTLEIVDSPSNANLRGISPAQFLDRLVDGAIESVKKDAVADGGTLSETTRLATYSGTRPAKLVMFERNVPGQKVRGQIIITYDERAIYILHSWCPSTDFSAAADDFRHFEKNFVVPEGAANQPAQTASGGRPSAR